jgi:hypothetical protein
LGGLLLRGLGRIGGRVGRVLGVCGIGVFSE